MSTPNIAPMSTTYLRKGGLLIQFWGKNKYMLSVTLDKLINNRYL